MSKITASELRLLCNDNGIDVADAAAILSTASKFGVPVVAAYRRARELRLLSYQIEEDQSHD